MIELQAAYIAALLLLIDSVCCLIAAWWRLPQLTVISGSGTAADLALVLGSLAANLQVGIFAAVFVAITQIGMKTIALRNHHA
jgi:hypothetical protein